MTRFGARILKLTFGLVIGLLLCEALLWLLPRRLLPKEFRLLDRVYNARGAWQDMMEGDSFVGYKLRPNLDLMFPSEGLVIPIHTKSFGLGDIGFRDIGTQPPFSVVAVGDSFVLCDDVPVEGCWVRHLADATGLSIATLGVNGYSNLAEERILSRYGRQLHPRLVLAGVYPNDFKDNVNFDKWTRSGSGNFWTWLGQQRGRGESGRFLSRYSMIYRIVDGALRANGRAVHKYKDDHLDFFFRLDPWWVDLTKRAEKNRGFPLMQRALLDMRAEATAMGAQFVVLLFPTKEQIYWDIARRYSKEDLDVDRPVEVVRQFCETNGIKFCTFDAALRAEARQGRQLYHRISSHWNDEGNAVGAQVIAKCLANYHLLDATAVAAQGGSGTGRGEQR
jgi:hypothetical protein